jgi:hypothetical protein
MKPFEHGLKGLSKHLYRIDEVLSSLRWSIITHNITETAFWTIELYQSNLSQECLELLETIWVYHIGFGSWFLLRLIFKIYEEGDITQDDLVSIACAFAKRRLCDSTVFHLLLRGTTSDSVKPFSHSKDYLTAQEAIHDCLSRGKLQEAWHLSKYMTEKELWQTLEPIASSLQRQEAFEHIKGLRTCRRESLALAFTLVSLDEISWIASQEAIENSIPIEISHAIDEWNSETNIRKRRAIKPRIEALLYLTRRSEQTPYVSSEPDIQHGLLETLVNSEYWSGILEEFMEKNKWKSERHKELFYETYFPQDIPDEWSLADREKSHGRGLGKSKEQARIRFIQLTLQYSKSLELWNSTFPSSLDCSMDWDTLYSVKPFSPMKSLKKTFIIN